MKKVLNGLTEEDIERASISSILESAEVTEKEYYSALNINTRGGIGVILKRTPQEIYVNNYNTEWLKNWNGNMDI